MDTINPTPSPRALTAAFGTKVYRYRSLLRRHWWILALTVAMTLAFQGWRLFTKPNLYESSSELRVREELAVSPDKFLQHAEHFYGDTLKFLASSEIHQGAKRRLDLEAPGLAGEVEITPSVAPKTSIFSVVGTGTNPEYTRRFVDAVVVEFIAFRRSERTSMLSEANNDISVELQNVRKDLERKRREFQTFVEKNDMGFWQKTSESAAGYLADLRTEQARLQNELNRLKNLTPEQLLIAPDSNAASSVPSDSPGPTSAQQNLLFSGELRTEYLQTVQQLRRKTDELEERRTVWKPKHPNLQRLEADVHVLRRKIETLTKQSAELAAGNITAIEAKLKSLEVSVGTWGEKVQEATKMDAEYNKLQAAVKRTEDQEDKLLTALATLSPNTGVNTGVPTVVRKASVAVPVSKGIAKHLIIGLLGGLLVGGVILFFMDRSDDRLSSSTEMIEHFSEPILAQIPNVADTRSAAGLPLMQAEDERYAYAEAFRSLRSSLIFMPNQSDLKTLVITSAIPNEGKSTIASNLAITMAASGARVLLVDADLRRGDLAALFDTDGRVGLSSVLRGDVAWKSVVQSTPHETLWLIPRGPVTNQSGELLLRPSLETVLDDFKSAYDLVIFNTAPILATDDTPTLAPHFDGTLMVVRAQFTSARLTHNALNALYQRQVNVLGLILNCVDTETPDYYYYRYPKYYAA